MARVQFTFHDTQIRVNIPDAEALGAAVRSKLAQGQGFALATINLDHLVKLRGSAPFRQAYAAQDLIVADGNPIVWLSRLAGKPVSLVPGSDMVVPLCRIAAECGVPVSMVGSVTAVLESSAARLKATVPGLKTGLLIAPPMGFAPAGDHAQAILRQLQDQGPSLCLVAMGAPRQEIFAALGRRLAPAVGFASIGAGLDFIAGAQTRAPSLFRALALEWLWRAMSSPRRLVPRYAACAAILPGQAVAALRQRRGG